MIHTWRFRRFLKKNHKRVVACLPLGVWGSLAADEIPPNKPMRGRPLGAHDNPYPRRGDSLAVWGSVGLPVPHYGFSCSPEVPDKAAVGVPSGSR